MTCLCTRPLGECRIPVAEPGFWAGRADVVAAAAVVVVDGDRSEARSVNSDCMTSTARKRFTARMRSFCGRRGEE